MDITINDTDDVVIEKLLIYPVKSLQGFSVDTTMLLAQGLEHDRHWMIINEEGKFITQRLLPLMSLVHTRIDGDSLILFKPSDPLLYDLVIPLQPFLSSQTLNLAPMFATIWKDECEVIDEGAHVSDWLAQAIGIPSNYTKKLHLVRMGETPRVQSKPELLGEDTRTFFADAAPFLIANQESLVALNEELADNNIDPVPMENFRPNIVISGLPAFAEHQVGELINRSYTFKQCYPCQRCVIPTINTSTGERHPQREPFSLLAKLNATEGQSEKTSKVPLFGENAILTTGDQRRIRIGDTLTIKRRS